MWGERGHLEHRVTELHSVECRYVLVGTWIVGYHIGGLDVDGPGGEHEV